MRVTAKLLLSAPIAYGHDGRGRYTLGIVILQQDLVYMSPQSVHTKVFFRQWQQLCLDRIGLKNESGVSQRQITAEKEPF